MVAGEDASTRAGEVVRTFDLAGEVEAERGREGVWEKYQLKQNDIPKG